jgi:hypothetical protein
MFTFFNKKQFCLRTPWAVACISVQKQAQSNPTFSLINYSFLGVLYKVPFLAIFDGK